jgi:hypothetical protein
MISPGTRCAASTRWRAPSRITIAVALNKLSRAVSSLCARYSWKKLSVTLSTIIPTMKNAVRRRPSSPGRKLTANAKAAAKSSTQIKKFANCFKSVRHGEIGGRRRISLRPKCARRSAASGGVSPVRRVCKRASTSSPGRLCHVSIVREIISEQSQIRQALSLDYALLARSRSARSTFWSIHTTTPSPTTKSTKKTISGLS